MPDDASAPNPPPSFPSSSFGGELPLTTIESFIAALVEAGPEVAEHMVRAAQELLLAAQALVSAAERNLAEQRRSREQAEAQAEAEAKAETETAAEAAAAHAADARDAPASDGATLRSVDEVA